MTASLRERVLADLRPEPVDDLSADGRLRLLDIAFQRVRFGMAAISLIGLPLYFVMARYGGAQRLAIWMLAYVGLSGWVLWRYHRFRRQLAGAEDRAELLVRWTPRVCRMALLHGSALSSAMLASSLDAPFEFTLLLLWTLSAVTVGNAVMQAPALRVFLHFFAASWLFIVLTVPWVVEPVWRWLMPLALLFSLSVYRLAVKTNRFFVRQVRLEEDSQRLAEQYRVASDAAAAALADKNRFLSTASHDLRQPLHAIGMIVEALRLRNRDPGQAALIDDLRAATDGMSLMFNSLLDLSRLEDDGVPPPPAVALRLDTLAHEVVRMFGEDAAARGLGLRLRAIRPATIQAPAVLVRQAMINLVHNALRYTRRGGVLVAVRRHGKAWRLQVWDTGIGVATEADQADQLFAPFHRQPQAWRIDDAGHGLGLAVVKRCADRMGAQVGFRSRLGRGSCFWLEMPAVAVAAPPEPLRSGAGAPSLRLSGRCLVVEDDHQVAGAWQALLQPWGVDVRCVAHGQAALQVLDAGFAPQVILCDERLRSGESGFVLLQDLMARCPDAAGAMVSGELNSPALAEAEESGYVVLSKPVDPALLHALLARWLPRAAPAAQALNSCVEPALR